MKNSKMIYNNSMNNKKYLIEYKKLSKNPIDAWVWFAEMTDKRDFPVKDFDFGYEQDYYLACENLGVKPPVDLKEKALEDPERCDKGAFLTVFVPDDIGKAILDLYD